MACVVEVRMAKFKPIEPMDFTRHSSWSDWKSRFTRYRVATKLDKDDEPVQVNALIYSMGSEAENIYKSFKFDPADDGNKYTPVINKFDAYFNPKKNTVHERAIFNTLSQSANENVETYLCRLYKQAENCDFGQLHDDHICD